MNLFFTFALQLPVGRYGDLEVLGSAPGQCLGTSVLNTHALSVSVILPISEFILLLLHFEECEN